MDAFIGLATVIFALWLSLFGLAVVLQQQAVYLRISRRLATYFGRLISRLVRRLARFLGRHAWRGTKYLVRQAGLGIRALWRHRERAAQGRVP